MSQVNILREIDSLRSEVNTIAAQLEAYVDPFLITGNVVFAKRLQEFVDRLHTATDNVNKLSNSYVKECLTQADESQAQINKFVTTVCEDSRFTYKSLQQEGGTP